MDTIYTAPQPMPNVTPSPKVKEILNRCKKEIDNIWEDLSMDRLGYEGYLEQANRKICDLKEKERIDDDTFKRLCNYLNYNLKKEEEIF